MSALSHALSLLLSCLLLAAPTLHAQIFSTTPAGNSLSSDQRIISDTSRKAQSTTDDRVRITQFSAADSSGKMPDTTIHLLHRNPLIGTWDMDLGATGTAVQSLYFQPKAHTAMRFGPDGFEPYLYDSLPFFNTTRPYTEIYYRIGSKQEQVLKLMHTQNIRPNWNLAAFYGKTGNPGYYKLQRSNHDHAGISSWYHSLNQRYRAEGSLRYNKLQQDENKGIADEAYLEDPAFRDRLLVPVGAQPIAGSNNRSAATNYYRQASASFMHEYRIGKADSVWNEDSSRSYTFTPFFGIRHRLYAEGLYSRFRDFAPATVWNQTGLDPYDSLLSKSFLNRYGTAFSLTGTLPWGIQAEAGYGAETDRIINGLWRSRYLNQYLFAEASRSGTWSLQATVRAYFSGIAQGNSLLRFSAGRMLPGNLGNLQAGFEAAIEAPSYRQQYFQANAFLYSASLKKSNRQLLWAAYSLPERKLSVDVRYHQLWQTIYYEAGNLQPLQYAGLIPLWQVRVQKEIHVGSFYLLNDVLWQELTDNPAIRLPRLGLRQTLSFRQFILKKKLQVATGLDLRYNTAYRADAYEHVLYGFVSQNARTLSNVPQLGYFFNFKVKRYRASVCFDELQSWFTRNNLNYPLYPAQNMMMRFGFYWVFIN